MGNHKITIAVAVAVVLAIIVFAANQILRNRGEETTASDQNYREQLQMSEINSGWKNITNEDVKRFWAADRDFSEQNVKEQFTGSVVNRDTLQFFRFMDRLFGDAEDLDDAFEKAELYLSSVLPPAQARQMLELYKTYVDYQIYMQENMEDWSITGSTREALDNLARIREYRRSVFGEENADLIFGALSLIHI